MITTLDIHECLNLFHAVHNIGTILSIIHEIPAYMLCETLTNADGVSTVGTQNYNE